MLKEFKLPDLGEGLADAVIAKWFVHEGVNVEQDDPVASMETAKALVDIPAPYSGKIVKLHGVEGDTINTGDTLITFELKNDTNNTTQKNTDSATVVGALSTDDNFDPNTATYNISTDSTSSVITPSAWRYIQKHNLDQEKLISAISKPVIGLIDLKSYHASQADDNTSTAKAATPKDSGKGKPITGVRAAMQLSMTQAHKEVACVSLFDKANLSKLAKVDFTIHIIQSLCKAVKEVPLINSHYYMQSNSIETFDHVNLGIAIDSSKGLYVPVIKNADTLDAKACRKQLNQLKEQTQNHTLNPDQLKDASISLSNFGSLGAQYGTPMIVPPAIAIIGIGQCRDHIISQDGKAVSAPLLPISLTVDHRVLTGGDATRFLAAFIKALEQG